MVGSKSRPPKFFVNLLIAAAAAVTVQCGGDIPAPNQPLIELSETSSSFSANEGGANPAAQTIQVTNRGEGALEGLGASVSYTGGQATGWLAATLSATTAPTILTLTATTGSLAEGTYSASVVLSSAAADNGPQSMTVTFTVGPRPAGAALISLSSTSQTFGAIERGADPDPQTVTVENGGDGSLSGLTATISYTSGAGWLAASLSSTSAPSTLTLTANTGTLAEGSYTANVAVASSGVSNSPQTVTVSFNVAKGGTGPTISLSSSSKSFTATQGGGSAPAQTVSIVNGGGGTLRGLAASVSYTSGNGWLAASLSSTTAPSTLSLTASPGTLTAGNYSASVAIASAGAGNSPQAVTVTLTVTPPQTSPSIALSSTSLTFSGAAPPAQTVSVTNGGTGPLSGLAASVSYTGQAGWLAASLSSTTAPSTLTLTATPGSLAAGSYTASVAVSSGVASNSPRTITVTLTVSPPSTPLIRLSQASLTFNATQGAADPPAQTVAVSNGGGGSLTGIAVSVGDPSQPVTAELSGTDAPATITVRALASFTPGTYNIPVTVSAPGAGNTPQSIAVALTIAPVPPTITSATASGTTVSLTWSYPWPGPLASSNDAYLLEQSTTSATSGFAEVQVYDIRTTPFTATLTRAAGTYFYRVRARLASQFSPYSEVKSVTVAPPAEQSQTFLASADNLLMKNSADATKANTVFRTSELAVGTSYFYTAFGTFDYLQTASVIKFDVQSAIAGKEILEATLRLFEYNLPGDFSGRFRLSAVIESWSPTTITWNRWMGMHYYSAGQIDFQAIASTVVPLELNVITIVQNWANGTFANNGLQLWEPSPRAPGFESYQATSIQSMDVFSNSTRRPQLFIRYR